MEMIFGIRIKLKYSLYTNNDLIGLWNSEFRWIQCAIDGLYDGWRDGLIIDGGIEKFTREIDLRKGGNVSGSGTGGVTIHNTTNFWRAIQSEIPPIQFAGCAVEIVRFSGITPIVVWTGICGEPTWDSVKFKIPFVGAQEKRNAQLVTVASKTIFPKIDGGEKVIPATFGELAPSVTLDGIFEISSVAKLPRISNAIDSRVYPHSYFSNSGQNPNLYIYPVNCEDPTDPTRISIYANVTDIKAINADPTDTYLHVIDGENKDQLRKVENIIASPGDGLIWVNIASPFKNKMHGSGEENISWVKIVTIARDYYLDSFPCKGFLKVDGSELSGTEIDVVAYDSAIDKFSALGQYSYENNHAANKALSIDPEFTVGSVDEIGDITILPITNVYLLREYDLHNWKDGEGQGYLSAYREQRNDYDGIEYPGVYVPSVWYDWGDATYSFGGETYISDRINTTKLAYSVDYYGSAPLAHTVVFAVGFDMPLAPKSMAVDETLDLYLGISGDVETRFKGEFVDGESNFRCMLRRWRDYVVVSMNDKVLDCEKPDILTENKAMLGSIPRWYFSDYIDPTIGTFYRNTEAGVNGYSSLTGYEQFHIGEFTKEEYDAFVQGALMFIASPYDFTQNARLWLNVNELCLMIRKTGSIKSELYTAARGRIFAESWQSRKDPAALMTDPVDIIEHACRLQNWQDVGVAPSSGWGLGYCASAQIDTASFDAITCVFDVSGQMTTEDEGTTENVKQALAQMLHVAVYNSVGGAEAVCSIEKGNFSTTLLFTSGNILNGDINITEARASDIYLEPFVRYNRNPATGKYDSIIGIKNTSSAAYSTGYLIGIPASDPIGQQLWGACHSLSFGYQRINQPPKTLTDLPFATGKNGYQIARAHLVAWVNHMFHREISFDVSSNDAIGLSEATPINVALSYHTDNRALPAIIEEIEVDPNPPFRTKIRGIILDGDNTAYMTTA